MTNRQRRQPFRSMVIAALALFAFSQASLLARPKVAVTIKQPELPRLGDFSQHEFKFFDENGNEESSSIDTFELDRIVKDESTGSMRYRVRSFSRDNTAQAGDLLSTMSNLREGYTYFTWSYIDPKLKAWVTEWQDEEWDDEKDEPTGKTTTMTDIEFPAPLTGQGQVIKDGDNVLKVTSINRKVTVPAGTFRCVVTEVYYPPAPDDPQSEGSLFIDYTHQRIGIVKSEMFAFTKGKRSLSSRMELQWAELHDKNGIKSHRHYALKKEPGASAGADGQRKAESR